jgi:hypothetical protein
LVPARKKIKNLPSEDENRTFMYYLRPDKPPAIPVDSAKPRSDITVVEDVCSIMVYSFNGQVDDAATAVGMNLLVPSQLFEEALKLLTVVASEQISI